HGGKNHVQLATAVKKASLVVQTANVILKQRIEQLRPAISDLLQFQRRERALGKGVDVLLERNNASPSLAVRISSQAQWRQHASAPIDCQELSFMPVATAGIRWQHNEMQRICAAPTVP